jgi:hypothetical protein
LTASSLYDFRVRGNCSGGQGAYAQSQFTTAAASTCPGTYDVTTNNTASGAATIPFNTDVFGLINTSSDVDYYKFVISTAGTATITLVNLPANYDLYLYSSNGTSQLAVSRSQGTKSESISGTFSVGTYYVKVIGKNGALNTSNCYTLRVQTGTAAAQDFTNANVEVKIFPNPTHNNISVYLVGNSSSRNLLMYDANGKVIYSQKVTDMITTLDMQRLAKGMYLVKVLSSTGVILHSEKVIKN